MTMPQPESLTKLLVAYQSPEWQPDEADIEASILKFNARWAVRFCHIQAHGVEALRDGTRRRQVSQFHGARRQSDAVLLIVSGGEDWPLILNGSNAANEGLLPDSTASVPPVALWRQIIADGRRQLPDEPLTDGLRDCAEGRVAINLDDALRLLATAVKLQEEQHEEPATATFVTGANVTKAARGSRRVLEPNVDLIGRDIKPDGNRSSVSGLSLTGREAGLERQLAGGHSQDDIRSNLDLCRQHLAVGNLDYARLILDNVAGNNSPNAAIPTTLLRQAAILKAEITTASGRFDDAIEQYRHQMLSEDIDNEFLARLYFEMSGTLLWQSARLDCRATESESILLAAEQTLLQCEAVCEKAGDFELQARAVQRRIEVLTAIGHEDRALQAQMTAHAAFQDRLPPDQVRQIVAAWTRSRLFSGRVQDAMSLAEPQLSSADNNDLNTAYLLMAKAAGLSLLDDHQGAAECWERCSVIAADHHQIMLALYACYQRFRGMEAESSLNSHAQQLARENKSASTGERQWAALSLAQLEWYRGQESEAVGRCWKLYNEVLESDSKAADNDSGVVAADLSTAVFSTLEAIRLNSARPELARDSLRKWIRKHGENNDVAANIGLGYAYQFCGFASAKNRRASESLEEFSQSSRCFTQAHDNYGLALTKFLSARLMANAQHLELAAESCQTARALAEDIGDFRLLESSLFELSEVYRRMERGTLQRLYLGRALRINCETSEDLLEVRAKHLQQAGFHQAAYEVYQRLWRAYGGQMKKDDQFKMLRQIAATCRGCARYSEAIQYYQQAAELLNVPNPTTGSHRTDLPKVLNSLGATQRNRDDLPAAIETLERALETSNGDPKHDVHASNTLSLAYLDVGERERAFDLSDMVLEYAYDKGGYQLARSLTIRGQLLYRTERYDDARSALEDGIAAADTSASSQRLSARAYLLLHLAKCERRTGNNVKAGELFEELRQTGRTSFEKGTAFPLDPLTRACLELSTLRRKAGDSQQALLFANEATGYAWTAGHRRLIVEAITATIDCLRGPDCTQEQQGLANQFDEERDRLVKAYAVDNPDPWLVDYGVTPVL